MSVVAACCSNTSSRSWVSRAICSSFPTVEVVARDAAFGAGPRFGLDDALWRRALVGAPLTTRSASSLAPSCAQSSHRNPPKDKPGSGRSCVSQWRLALQFVADAYFKPSEVPNYFNCRRTVPSAIDGAATPIVLAFLAIQSRASRMLSSVPALS